jgi:signal transduction histidine kinase
VLVDDLLLLAHLDEGQPLAQEPVQLDDVVSEAVETARIVDPERPIELDAQPVAGTAFVCARSSTTSLRMYARTHRGARRQPFPSAARTGTP